MTLWTLMRRQVAARPWPTMLLAFTVAVVSALATAIPRLVADLDDRQLAQRLGSLSAIAGDVSGTWSVPAPLDGQLHDPWDDNADAAEAIRQAQPEPLRSLLAPAQFVAQYATTTSSVPPQASGYYTVTWHLLVDPALAEHAELTDGAWPALDDEGPQQVAVLADAATRMGWEVGDVVGNDYLITGIFRPRDATDVRWEHLELGRRYNELSDPNRGIELEVGVFLPDELAGGDPTGRLQAPFRTTLWFRLDPAAVGGSGVDVDSLNAQVTGLTAPSWSVSPDGATTVRLATELGPALTSVSAQQVTTRTLVWVSAAGPLGVGAALVLLAARLVADRRRGTSALTAARGLSRRQQRSLALVEGLAVGVPSAALGHLADAALSPGTDGWVAWFWTLLVALVPAGLLTASLTAAPGSPGRATARWRVVAEMLVLLAAGVSAWQLASGPTGGVLAVASPLLVAVAVVLAVLRLYPLPLRALQAALRPRRGLVGFLGAARGLRSPAGGAVPVAAVVLGTTMAVTSSLLLGTVSAEVDSSAWSEVGGDVRVSGPPITDEMAGQLAGIDGVAAVTRLRLASSNETLRQGDDSTLVRLWLANDSLPVVYAAAAGGDAVPEELFEDGGDARIVTGGAGGTGSGTLGALGAVTVARSVDDLPGVLTGSAWALADVDRWPGGGDVASTLALVSLDDDADPAAVADRVAGLLPTAKVQTAAAELDALRSSPTLTGLTRIFGVLALGTVGLLLLATAASQALAAQERRSLGAILRTLGLGPAQLRQLTAWELAPIVAVALLVGATAGLGIAALLVRSVDLASLTESATAPSLHVDPLGLGAVLAGLLAAAGLSILTQAWRAGRVDVADQLRRNDDTTHA